MMDVPLTIQSILRHGLSQFGRKTIVTRQADGGTVRQTFTELGARTERLAAALKRLGVTKGDRVGTFAWNSHRHLEAYFAVPNMGAVLHTINIRLFPQQLIHVINHAQDQVLLIDADLLPTIEGVAEQLDGVRHFVVLDKSVPQTSLPNVLAYEELLAEAGAGFDWPALDEDDPSALCYTSATTGNPKGVIYTHRSQYLHTMALGLVNNLGLCEADTLLPFVPMFHVNAWGLPFGAIAFGSTLVLPGSRPDAKAILDLMERERVTVAAGVPTIWLAAAELLEAGAYRLEAVRSVICGGAAIPPALLRRYDRLGLPVLHAYGMTETSPLASCAHLRTWMADWPQELKFQVRTTQGSASFGVEFRVVDEEGSDVPQDGKTFGQLLMRGPWVASEYYRDDRGADTFKDGWLYSGDIVTWDEDGYITIVDRAKDLVKSGGEWISSVDLENAIMAMDGVAEAAVIGVTHPRWQERPLACVVPKRDAQIRPTKEDILERLRSQFPKWWVPDDVVFVEEIPKSSVGKFQKRDLRERFAGYVFSDA